MKIPISSDHAGVELKSKIIKSFPLVQWEDLGPSNSDRVDYPDYASKLARLVSSSQAEKGIIICGSGIGVSIVANKFKGVRAALVGCKEAAVLSREHNNSNVLCLGSRGSETNDDPLEIVDLWLKTPFSGEPRHEKRIEKIRKIEEENFK